MAQTGETSPWTPVGDALYDPVAVSPEPGKTLLLARNVSGEMICAAYDGETWQPWRSLGRPAAREGSTPIPVPVDWPMAACCSGPGQIDLIARSPEGELLHARGSIDQLTTFDLLGAPASFQGSIAVPMGIVGTPAVCSRQDGHIDVLAIGIESDLLHTEYDGASWRPFESLGMPSMDVSGTMQVMPICGPVAACGVGEDRLGVFFRGAFGDLVIKWWDGTAWSAYTSLGTPQVQNEMYPAVTVPSPLAGAPAACSPGPERIDVLVRGSQGDMLHIWWNGAAWSGFESLWMPVSAEPEAACLPFTGVVTVCAPSKDHLHLFARALDGQLYHRSISLS